MNRILVLDTGPLGLLTNPRKPENTLEILRWAAAHLRAGNRLLVPAIADFEVRRELLRLNRPTSIAALDAFIRLPQDRYIPFTDNALQLSAILWARARNAGTPTADPKELDCDVLIAAQAQEYKSLHELSDEQIIIATVNVGHLAQFIAADLWSDILP
ncbi:type II toxin-antitoxin system VapC family toxin [Armatimonas sp.]|uniref:type II toxin-antitoxin system VapC family toxin n=1 Tax=Armatimonas sp. TaxID=1872638 RepID=UPI00374D7830